MYMKRRCCFSKIVLIENRGYIEKMEVMTMHYLMFAIITFFCCGPIIVSQLIINHEKKFEDNDGGVAK